MPGSAKTKSTICLNMIVKNEAHIIERCLESVLPHVDYWVISDTGSTDGTQDIIRAFMKDVPGELLEHEWRDFGHNRDLSLQAAAGRADYILTIDADEWLEPDDGFDFGLLERDAYYIQKQIASTKYWVPNVIRNDAGWYWKGVIHEYIENSRDDWTRGEIHGCLIQARREGARSLDPNTYKKDAALLVRALVDEPDNTRYQFYLAQSCRDAEELELAIHHYRKRVALGGWQEEVYCSLYQVALAMENLGRPWPDVLCAYLEAWNHTPARAEPLFRIGANYYDMGNFPLAKLFLDRAAALAVPENLVLFIEAEVYNYIAAYYAGSASEIIGEFEDAINHYDVVLEMAHPDDRHVEQAEEGLRRCKEQLKLVRQSAA